MKFLSSYFDIGQILSWQYIDTFTLNKMCLMIYFVARGNRNNTEGIGTFLPRRVLS